MTYKEAKEYKKELENIIDHHTEILNKFKKLSMGIIPDHTRETEEFKQAKKNFDKSFKELRNFNSYFTKIFKKEYLEEILARNKARQTTL